MTLRANTRSPDSVNRIYSDFASLWMKPSLTSCQCWQTCFVASKSSTYHKIQQMSPHQMLSSYKLCQRFELASSKTKTGKRLRGNKVEPSSLKTQSKSAQIWTDLWNYTPATYSRTSWMTLSARNVAPWPHRGAPAARWPGTAPETASSANGRSTSSFVLCSSKRKGRNNKAVISQQQQHPLVQLPVLRLVARRKGRSYKSCE